MAKRGEVAGEVVKYFLIAVIIILIQLAGFKFYNVIKEKQCVVELNKFQIELSALPGTVEAGSVESSSYGVPCGADEIHFFDLNEKINLEAYSDMPQIRDSIEGRAQKNIFIKKSGKILSSFYAGDLDLGYPYYSCLSPYNGRISFFLEGMGASAAIVPGCEQPECTLIPEFKLSEEEAKTIINHALSSEDCTFCPKFLYEGLADFRSALAGINIYRRFKFCPDTGITQVEITLKPKAGYALKGVTYFEYIPKECIEDLDSYLAEEIPGEVYIKSDPLIVWHFDEIRSEKVLKYKLNKSVSLDCQRIIQGMLLSEITSRKGSPRTLEVIIPKTFELFSVENKELHLSAKSNYYPRDEISWVASGQNNLNVLVNNKPKNAIVSSINNFVGNEVVTFTATAPDGMKDSLDINVNVLASCADACHACEFSSSCEEEGKMMCTKLDCTLYEQICTRETDSIKCGENSFCMDGSCLRSIIGPPAQGGSQNQINTPNPQTGQDELIANVACAEDCAQCAYSGVCINKGAQPCTRKDCTTYQQDCTRNTDGNSCGTGMVCLGEKCDYKRDGGKIPCKLFNGNCPPGCSCGIISGYCKKNGWGYFSQYC